MDGIGSPTGELQGIVEEGKERRCCSRGKGAGLLQNVRAGGGDFKKEGRTKRKPRYEKDRKRRETTSDRGSVLLAN